jgi:hypothetical protein
MRITDRDASVVSSLSLFNSAPHVCAADFSVLSSTTTATGDDPVCNVRLSGPIVAGDNKKLESELDTVGPRGAPSDHALGRYRTTLCLSSPGGSYSEGLQIANSLLEQHFRTMIEPNAICYSACTLIFVAGNFQFEGQYFPDRRLHVAGQLGFHAPYIKRIPQQTYSSFKPGGNQRRATPSVTPDWSPWSVNCVARGRRRESGEVLHPG